MSEDQHGFDRKTVRGLILGFFIGIVCALVGTALVSAKAKPCAQTYDAADHLKNVDQEIFDTQSRVLTQMTEENTKLRAQLAQEQVNPVTQALASSGHVMNEQQCRAWINSTSPLK